MVPIPAITRMTPPFADQRVGPRFTASGRRGIRNGTRAASTPAAPPRRRPAPARLRRRVRLWLNLYLAVATRWETLLRPRRMQRAIDQMTTLTTACAGCLGFPP
jgi:hypothetical protein